MTRVPLKIRDAQPSDWGAVADLWHDSASQPGVGPPDMPTKDDLRKRVEVEACEKWKLLVAEEDGEIVGMLALVERGQMLDQLFVRPSHFRTGLGLKLFERAKAELHLGFTLHTASSNVRARRFYEREGMTFVREGRHPRTGHPVSYYNWEPS